MTETWLQRWVLNGGFTMFALVPCSVAAMAFIIQGLISLRRERMLPRSLQQMVAGARDPIDLEAARRRITVDPSPLARVVTGLCKLTTHSEEELEREADRLAGEEALLLYHRRVAPLALLRNIAVYLGLFGTVLGIMHAFSQYIVGQHADVQGLGRGIAEALVTTVWGLAIAIPSMVFLYVFREKLVTLERVKLPEEALTLHRRLTRPELFKKLEPAVSR
jgi:biopolymer transport protein ExbB